MLVRFGGEVQEVSRPLSGRPTRFLAVTFVGLAAVLGFTTFRVWQAGTDDDRRPVDAIVVLGAAQYDGRPSPVFAARLDHAIDLFRAGVAPRIVVTGGKADGDRVTEGAAARAYLTAHGIPPDAILGGDTSRTTLASIRAVAGVLRDHDLAKAVFVSDPTHMLRVLRMAHDSASTATGRPPGPARSIATRRPGSMPWRTRSVAWSSTS